MSSTGTTKHTPGRCRICGCTELNACIDADGNACAWMDEDETLCDSLDCIARMRISELEAMQPKLAPSRIELPAWKR